MVAHPAVVAGVALEIELDVELVRLLLEAIDARETTAPVDPIPIPLPVVTIALLVTVPPDGRRPPVPLPLPLPIDEGFFFDNKEPGVVVIDDVVRLDDSDGAPPRIALPDADPGIGNTPVPPFLLILLQLLIMPAFARRLGVNDGISPTLYPRPSAPSGARSGALAILRSVLPRDIARIVRLRSRSRSCSRSR